MSEIISKVCLYVPFSQKDKVKECKCLWDPEKKKWYFTFNKSIQCLKKLIDISKKERQIYFIKQYVSDDKAKLRNDCFKPDYRLCFNIVEYKEDELLELYKIYNEHNSKENTVTLTCEFTD